MVRGGLFATGVLLIVAGPAFAQDASRAEISAGWRQHHVTITSVVRPLQVEVPNDYPKGWYADAAVNVSEKFAIVAEAAGSRFEDAFEQPSNVVSIRESLDVAGNPTCRQCVCSLYLAEDAPLRISRSSTDRYSPY